MSTRQWVVIVLFAARELERRRTNRRRGNCRSPCKSVAHNRLHATFCYGSPYCGPRSLFHVRFATRPDRTMWLWHSHDDESQTIFFCTEVSKIIPGGECVLAHMALESEMLVIFKKLSPVVTLVILQKKCSCSISRCNLCCVIVVVQ